MIPRTRIPGVRGLAVSVVVASALAAVPASGARLARVERPTSTSERAGALSHLYWTEPETDKGPSGSGINTIWRAGLNGMNVNRNFVTRFEVPGVVAVGGAHIYFSDSEAGGIGRAELDGTHVDASFIHRNPDAIAVTKRYIYLTDSLDSHPAIWRANINGSHLRRLFLVGSGTYLGGLAIHLGHIYWTNRDQGTIGRADLNGGHVRLHFITGLDSPTGLAVGRGRLYWSSTVPGPGDPSSIGRASLSGGNVQHKFIKGVSYPYGVAVGAGRLYWADYGAGTIGRARLNGAQVQPSFISAQPMFDGSAGADPFGVAVGP